MLAKLFRRSHRDFKSGEEGSRPVNIIVSTPTFLPITGGAELGIHEIYSRIGAQHKVRIVTRRVSSKELQLYGTPIIDGDTYQVSRFESRLQNLRPVALRRIATSTGIAYAIALARECIKDRPDIINFQFIKPHGLVSFIFDRLFRIPVAFSLVGRSDVLHRLGPWSRLHAKLSLVCAKVVIQNSAYYTQGISMRPKVLTVPYGVDVQKYGNGDGKRARRSLGIDEQSMVLLAVQRLDRVKRVDLLLEIFDSLAARNDRVHIVVVGIGPCSSELAEKAAKLSAATRVHLVGYVAEAELQDYFAMANVFVSHSMFETFGVVFAQALAAGVPIVAADTSCVRSVIPSDCGVLVPPDDLDAFEAAVDEVLSDMRRRGDMEVAGKKYSAENFDWERIADEYVRIFSAAVGPRQF